MFIRSLDDGVNTELVLVEMQGELTTRTQLIDEFTTEGLEGIEMGVLTLKFGRPHLRVGNHVLEGKVVKLPKALVVTLPSKISVEGDNNTEEEKVENFLGIVGVIRSKVIFSTRPKPVVSQRKKEENAAKGKKRPASDNKIMFFNSAAKKSKTKPVDK